jgi:hypothetical protein
MPETQFKANYRRTIFIVVSLHFCLSRRHAIFSAPGGSGRGYFYPDRLQYANGAVSPAPQVREGDPLHRVMGWRPVPE